jgi:predicted P-loop ATPase
MATAQTYIDDLLALGYTFKYNEATDSLEVNGRQITDVLQAEIRARMRDKRHKQMTAIEDAYTAHAWANRFHPIRDYLNGLTWSGEPAIANLAAHFTDRHDVFGLFLRRWMIGAVAKVLERGQNFMLVLESVQDLGKSRFVRWLCPPSLSAYFVEGPIDTQDKDTWGRLAGRWIWETPELGATTRRADREALKDFISRQEVTLRKAYARNDITRPALASLIGTINEEGSGFLNDPTGSRRFAIASLTGIDYAYSALPVDDLWAEAYVAYQAGEPWQLTETERAAQVAINEEYEVSVPLEGLLLKYYDIDLSATGWASSTDIIQELEIYGLKDNQRASLMELARVMQRLGVERQRIRRVYSYRGVTRKP